MRKDKIWEVDLFDQRPYSQKSIKQLSDPEFWTSDTEAFLVFKLFNNATVDSATLNLYNRDDKSLVVDLPMIINQQDAELKLTKEIIAHFGTWSAQVIFSIGGESNTTSTVSFSVGRELGADLPERLGVIEEWKDLNNEVKSFVAEIEGFTLDQFVELKMGEELQNLESNYATRLTGLETNDATLTAQLAQKANQALVTQTEQRLDEKKADKSEVVAIDNKLGALGSVATFKGSDTNANILSKTNKVVGDEWFDTTNNQALRWNGTAWVAVGGSIKLGDKTVTLNNLTVTKPVTANLFDKAKAINKSLNRFTGELAEDNTFYTDLYMPVVPGETYNFTHNINSYVFSGANREYKTGEAGPVKQITIPTDVYYLSYCFYYTNLNAFMASRGSLPLTYVAYKQVIDGQYIGDLPGSSIKNKDLGLEKMAFVEQGKNLLNPDKVIKGKYVNTTTGALLDNPTYDTTEIIAGQAGESIVVTTARFVAFYNLFGEFAPEHSINAVDNPREFEFSLPAGTAGYRISYVASEQKMQIERGDKLSTYEPYTQYLIGVVPKPIAQDDTKKSSKSVRKGNLTDGQKLATELNSIKKNKTLSFFAEVGSFGSIRIGHGESEYGASYIDITATEIKLYDMLATATPRATLSHGLTINGFIDIMVIVDKDSQVTVRIMSSGGFYESPKQAWMGYNGTPFVKSIGSTFNNCEFVFNSTDFQKPIYFFGDSYSGLTVSDRWPYYVRTWGFDDWLINGFPGQASVSAKGMLDYILSKGTPKILIWGLGMNDGDTNAVNQNWLSTYHQVKSLCDEYKIEFVPCTIPNTPTINNLFKNDIVRDSGYRYIDFAKGVGAEGVNSNWYTGMLSNDNVHPTALGAMKLAQRAVMDVPELAKS